MDNYGKMKACGIETSLKIQFFPWMKLYMNYTYQKILKEKSPANISVIKYRGTMPIHKGNIGINCQFNKYTIHNMPYLNCISFNVNLNYRDKYRNLNEADFAKKSIKIKEHFRLDCRIGKTFFNDSIEIAFIGQNLIGNGNKEKEYVKVPKMLFLTVTIKEGLWNLLKRKK